MQMHECDQIICAPFILTQNAARDVLENAAIAVLNGKIAAIGEQNAVLGAWQAREKLKAADCLLMPALINAHCHAAMTFLRGLADDLPLMEWLTGTVFPVEKRLTHEITRLGSLLGYAEMLSTGCGACIDMYIYEDAVFEAADLAGMRCLGGEAIFDFPSAACRSAREAMERTREMAQKYAGHDRIGVAVNPHSVYTTTPEILKKSRALAQGLDLPLHIHLAETEAETAACLKNFQCRPIEYCEKLGLLEGKTVAAHLVHITAKEAAYLAESGVIGVHNPSSNMKLASGACPVETAQSKGLHFALGTDGPASNNQLNMFAEMRQAALLAKLQADNPAALPAQKILDMATREGAKAFGADCTGTLEPGAPADIIALDLKCPNMQPFHNAVSQAVYGATGRECRMTMIAGEILYKDGQFTRFNYDDLLRETKELRQFARKCK